MAVLLETVWDSLGDDCLSRSCPCETNSLHQFLKSSRLHKINISEDHSLSFEEVDHLQTTLAAISKSRGPARKRCPWHHDSHGKRFAGIALPATVGVADWSRCVCVCSMYIGVWPVAFVGWACLARRYR